MRLISNDIFAHNFHDLYYGIVEMLVAENIGEFSELKYNLLKFLCPPKIFCMANYWSIHMIGETDHESSRK